MWSFLLCHRILTGKFPASPALWAGSFTFYEIINFGP